MTLPQASAVPITKKTAIETITLKNLVALDVVEKNEYLLKAFRLLDDSRLKVQLNDSKSKQELERLIESKKAEIEKQKEDLKMFKHQISEGKDPNSELINNLASDFLKDEISNDNTDELVAKFEKENNVKVLIDDTGDYYKQFQVDFGIKVDTKPEFIESEPQPQQEQDQQQPQQPQVQIPVIPQLPHIPQQVPQHITQQTPQNIAQQSPQQIQQQFPQPTPTQSTDTDVAMQ